MTKEAKELHNLKIVSKEFIDQICKDADSFAGCNSYQDCDDLKERILINLRKFLKGNSFKNIFFDD